MRKVYYFLTLAFSLGLAAQSALCADARQAVPTMTYVHVYADSAGVSHFREEHLDFAPGRTEETSIHALEAKGRTTLLRLRVGAVEDWHNAPRAWFLIVLQGASEVTTSDGEVRLFGPGALVLLDDTTGKGHRTRAIGTIDHVAAVIPIADDAPVTGAK
jgi:quercetin dioxygenase-like cupin family protein